MDMKLDNEMKRRGMESRNMTGGYRW